MKILLRTLILGLLVACSGGGGNSNTSTVVKGNSSDQMSQDQFVQTEIKDIKSKLAEDPKYVLTSNELSVLRESGEFTDEELNQFNQLL